MKEERVKGWVDMAKMGYEAVGDYYGKEILNFVQYIDDNKKEVLKQLHKYKYEKYGVKLAFDIKKGDHIYILYTKPIVYEHHGIYVGKGKTVHFRKEGIVEESLEVFACECVVRKAPDLYLYGDAPYTKTIKKRYPPDKVCKRAYMRIGETGYKLLTNNCEHFASWCKTGYECSLQVKALGLKSFLHYVPGFNTMIMYD